MQPFSNFALPQPHEDKEDYLQTGRSCVSSWQSKIFLFVTTCRGNLGPTQPPI